MPEENYDEEYVINILADQANLNLKYGQSDSRTNQNAAKPQPKERRMIPR